MITTNDSTSKILIDFDETASSFKRQISARLRLHHTDLLGSTDKNGVYQCFDRLWIHPFATSGLVCMVRCQKYKEASWELFEGWGSLEFRLKGENLFIYATTIDASFTLAYEDMLSAWKRFGARVYRQVVGRHPEMKAFFDWAGIVDAEAFTYERAADQSWTGAFDKSWFEEDDGTCADFGY